MTAIEFAAKIEEHAFDGDLTIRDEDGFYLVTGVEILNGIVEIIIKKDSENE